MSEVSMQPCAAAEGSYRRAVRYAAGTFLLLIAVVECGAASMMLAGQRGVPQSLYLLAALALLAATVVAVLERRRALLAVRVCSIAAALMLFWAVSVGGEPNVRFGGRVHDLTPGLASMLLASLLLPAALRLPRDEVACNCS